MVSREATARLRTRLKSTGKGAKVALGLFLIAKGMLILFGLDKALETYLVDVSPDWLTRLTTRI